MSGKKPNVVLCLCDEMRAFEVGCYGHPVVRTPNIDRLAADGAMFQIGCSNAPLCVPARSVLLSGQHARTCTGTTTNYCGLPPSRERKLCPDTLLPEILRDDGYATGMVGKWHLHPAPDVVGFQEGTIPHNHHQHFNQYFYDLKGEQQKLVRSFSLDYEIEHVRRFIHAHREGPFFLEYSLSPPHSPIADAPEKYQKMYSRDEVILRDNVTVDGVEAFDKYWFQHYPFDFLGVLMDRYRSNDWIMDDDQYIRETQAPPHATLRLMSDLAQIMEEEPYGPELRKKLPYVDDRYIENFDLKDLTALYYGMVSLVDDYVGKMMDTLREEGIADNTLVIFTSDHGDNLGSHHLWNKGHVFDESIRIPLVFCWPGKIPSKRHELQVGSLIDVMPTVLSLLNLAVPDSVQGRDLSEVLRGSRDTLDDNMVFIEGLHPQIGVRTPTHLYGMEMTGDSEPERKPAGNVQDHYFFDMTVDPFQMNNRAEEGGDSTMKDDLRRRLTDWHEQTPRLPLDWKIRKPHKHA